MVTFPQETADQVRAAVLGALRDAARRARTLNSGTDARLQAHLQLNYEEQPLVGFAVSVVSGEEPVELQGRVLEPLTDSRIALRRFERMGPKASLAEVGEAVLTAVEKADEAQRLTVEGIDRSIAAAGSIVRGLEITRDLSIAVALAIGAILAAPVVAAGVAGLGATGLTAAGLTAVGTGGVVGAGGYGVGFVGGALGELSSGGGVDRALEAGTSEGRRVGAQGVVTGLTGGTARVVSGALGVGRTGLTLGQNVLRSSVAQGFGGGVGGVAQGLLAEPVAGASRGDQVLRSGLAGLGTGLLGGTAGALARPLTSPAAQYAVGVGLPGLGAGGVTYLQTGDYSKALQSTAVSLAAGAAGRVRAAQGTTRGEVRAFETGRTVANTTRAYALAAGLGLYQSSPAFSLGHSGGPSAAPLRANSAITARSTSVPSATTPDPATPAPAAPAAPAAAAPAAPAAPAAAAPANPTPAPPVPPTQAQPAAQAAQPAVTPTATPAAAVPGADPAATTASATTAAAVGSTVVAPATATDEASFAGVITPSAPSRPLRSSAIAAEEGSLLNAGALVGTHSVSPAVRRAAGVSGAQFESAHILAQTIGAAINNVVPGRYSAGRALAILLPPQAHRAFDRGWVSLWNARVASNQRTTVRDAHRLLAAAIDAVPSNLMTSAEKGGLHLALDQQVYQTLGLSPDLVLFGGP